MGRKLKCDFAKDLVISGTDLQKISLGRQFHEFFFLVLSEIISRVFSNLEVHVCNFGCRCRPIHDGRVTRVNFSAFPCMAFFGKLLRFKSRGFCSSRIFISYCTILLGIQTFDSVKKWGLDNFSTLKNHQICPKIGIKLGKVSWYPI